MKKKKTNICSSVWGKNCTTICNEEKMENCPGIRLLTEIEHRSEWQRKKLGSSNRRNTMLQEPRQRRRRRRKMIMMANYYALLTLMCKVKVQYTDLIFPSVLMILLSNKSICFIPSCLRDVHIQLYSER